MKRDDANPPRSLGEAYRSVLPEQPIHEWPSWMAAYLRVTDAELASAPRPSSAVGLDTLCAAINATGTRQQVAASAFDELDAWLASRGWTCE